MAAIVFDRQKLNNNVALCQLLLKSIRMNGMIQRNTCLTEIFKYGTLDFCDLTVNENDNKFYLSRYWETNTELWIYYELWAEWSLNFEIYNLLFCFTMTALITLLITLWCAVTVHHLRGHCPTMDASHLPPNDHPSSCQDTWHLYSFIYRTRCLMLVYIKSIKALFYICFRSP